MASRSTKRALMGFALGALKGASDFYQTQRAQEAERLKEERLAAVRARERGEDRAFQRETLQMQQSAQTERDERTLSAQAERDARQEAARLKEIEMQGRNQQAYAAAMRTPDRPQRVLMDIGGKVVAVSMDDPRLAEGVEGTILQGSSGARFQPRTDSPRQSSTSTSGESTTIPTAVRGDDSIGGQPAVERMVYDDKLKRWVKASSVTP